MNKTIAYIVFPIAIIAVIIFGVLSILRQQDAFNPQDNISNLQSTVHNTVDTSNEKD